ncbi:uncharacterized protein H6S33_002734 [Morchella sextelata]|uniref:uncharacterized protein n=1 Tax=Morchella sextelata TaxID=1174677 RepID=UPI001D04BC9F|nr:uncharacterized protein H6S33_002734 [Morchella sextelata]KAH0607700.1 hypothetical protein H6S33_002734 [Morchella sextelata]
MYLDRPIDQQFPPTPPLRRSPSPVDEEDEEEREDPDLSSLRRTHTTLGYRDGITASKSTYIQSGFDESYPLGGRFGLKIGWIKGVLEGLWMLDKADERVSKLRREANVELDLQKVFAKEWFDEGGVWKYGLGEEEEEGVTLDRVVEKHPVVEAWMVKIKEEAKRWGLEVEELVYHGEEEEEEKGEPSTGPVSS